MVLAFGREKREDNGYVDFFKDMAMELRKKTARQAPRNPPANLWGRNYPRAQKKTPQRTDFSHVFYCLTRNIELMILRGELARGGLLCRV